MINIWREKNFPTHRVQILSMLTFNKNDLGHLRNAHCSNCSSCSLLSKLYVDLIRNVSVNIDAKIKVAVSVDKQSTLIGVYMEKYISVQR